MYDGEWEENKIQGFGRMTYPDGTYYEGKWKKGYKHGKRLRRKMENTFMESGKWENLLFLVLKLVENDKNFLKIKFRFEPRSVN